MRLPSPGLRPHARSRWPHGLPPRHDAALPNLIVIGAMKCGTTALHRYLDHHPHIAMSRPKELNFFFGPEGDAPEDGESSAGNWHRGVSWYARHFSSTIPVRGESSPGYTSPSHPGVAVRMASVIPDARLVYLVRDPVERALSQYRHHVADGTERRSADEALLDPDSQYVARSRYYERLSPFLERFDRRQLLVVAHEDLLTDRRGTLRSLFGFLGVDTQFWSDAFTHRWHTAVGPSPPLRPRTRDQLATALADDVERLRRWMGRDLPGWNL